MTKKMNQTPCLPYMGSKRTIAVDIYNVICAYEGVGNDSLKTLVEPFCGGLAVGSAFLYGGWSVVSSDNDKYVIALLNKVITEGIPDDILLSWVTRKEFFKVNAAPDDFDDWYVGYIRCVFSFGNKSSSYIYGVSNEQIKQIGHRVVTGDTVNSRRLALRGLVAELHSSGFDRIELLRQLQHLERIQAVKKMINLSKYISSGSLNLVNSDYTDLEIPVGAVVYADPPYINTAGYASGDFNQEMFWDWARRTSKTNRVYISGYEAPEDFISVWEKSKTVTLQGGSNNSQKIEKLFMYKGKLSENTNNSTRKQVKIS